MTSPNDVTRGVVSFHETDHLLRGAFVYSTGPVFSSWKSGLLYSLSFLLCRQH